MILKIEKKFSVKKKEMEEQLIKTRQYETHEKYSEATTATSN